MTDLMIDDVIGGDGWWFEGVTSKSVNRFLNENAKRKEIVVRFNSAGGDSIEGVAIYNALKRASQDGQKIVGEVDGMAASAASIILMACDEIRMHKGTFVMIHEAWTYARGDASDLESIARLLRTVNGEMADLYSARTGNDKEKCLALMSEETWFTADSAKEFGFCDSILPAKTVAKKPEREAAKAKQMLAAYKHAPAALVEVNGPNGGLGQLPPRNASSAASSPLALMAKGAARIGEF